MALGQVFGQLHGVEIKVLCGLSLVLCSFYLVLGAGLSVSGVEGRGPCWCGSQIFEFQISSRDIDRSEISAEI